MSSAHPSTAISKQSLLALRQYWFEGMEGPSPDQKQVEATMEKWFGGAKAVDEWCRNECGDMLKQADGETVEQLKEHAGSDPQDAVSLILLLDQMPRNVFRSVDEQGRVYTDYDYKALALCKHFISDSEGVDEALKNDIWFKRLFLYMPLMHSENLEDHKLLIAKATKALNMSTDAKEKNSIEQMIDMGDRHREPACKVNAEEKLVFVLKEPMSYLAGKVIERFSRYPSRNECLGRKNTAEEKAFLEERGKGW